MRNMKNIRATEKIFWRHCFHQLQARLSQLKKFVQKNNLNQFKPVLIEQLIENKEVSLLY